MNFEIFLKRYAYNLKTYAYESKYRKIRKILMYPYSIFLIVFLSSVCILLFKCLDISSYIEIIQTYFVGSSGNSFVDVLSFIMLNDSSYNLGNVDIDHLLGARHSIRLAQSIMRLYTVIIVTGIAFLLSSLTLIIHFFIQKRDSSSVEEKKVIISREKVLYTTALEVYSSNTSNAHDIPLPSLQSIISKKQLITLMEYAKGMKNERDEVRKKYQIIGSILLTLIVTPLYKKIIESQYDKLITSTQHTLSISLEILLLAYILLVPILIVGCFWLFLGIWKSWMKKDIFTELISDIQQITFSLPDDEPQQYVFGEISIKEKFIGKEINAKNVSIPK